MFFLDIRLHPIQYVTMVLAMVGATLAPDIDAYYRGWGFFAWIISNGVMLYEFFVARNIPYSILFLYYEIQNMRGVVNNWWIL